MATVRFFRSVARSVRFAALAPAFLFTAAAFTAPAPAQAQSVGVQSCTVVLFVEVCTGGSAGTGSGGSASAAPAPMLGGSILSLAALGGFVALRRRNAAKADQAEQPSIEG